MQIRRKCPLPQADAATQPSAGRARAGLLLPLGYPGSCPHACDSLHSSSWSSSRTSLLLSPCSDPGKHGKDEAVQCTGLKWTLGQRLFSKPGLAIYLLYICEIPALQHIYLTMTKFINLSIPNFCNLGHEDYRTNIIRLLLGLCVNGRKRL